jgi:hypothetical protein
MANKIPLYGTFPYDRARAIEFVESLIAAGEFANGGEQCPNRLSALELGMSLKKHVDTLGSSATEEHLAFHALAEQLIRTWHDGLGDEYGRNGPTLNDLETLMTKAIQSVPLPLPFNR